LSTHNIRHKFVDTKTQVTIGDAWPFACRQF
jgi:hypothetical protein